MVFIEFGDEDALGGDEVPGAAGAGAEFDGGAEEAEAGEDEGEAEVRDEAPPAFEAGEAGAVIPEGAEYSPSDGVGEAMEAAEDKDVRAGAGLPDDGFAGVEEGRRVEGASEGSF